MLSSEGSLCGATLIAGFLGAGKTTLLRNVLGWRRDLPSTVVLINEFGQIGIDGELLQGLGVPVVELANGCICCTIQGDLVRSVGEILMRMKPARLLIEATGVADPVEVIGALRHGGFQGRLDVSKVVTVLDADFWENREYLGPLFFNQLRAADLVLLNKIDLLAPQDVPRCLREIQAEHPSCCVVPTYHCQVDPELLWSPVARHGLEVFPEIEVEHDARQLGFVAFGFEEKLPFQGELFRRFLAELPWELYRVKGFVLVEEGLYFINHVGRKTEWMEMQTGTGGTRLSFVGWNVEEQMVIAQLRECVVSSGIHTGAGGAA